MCHQFGFQTIFGERSGLDKASESTPEFLERLREAICSADLLIVDVTGFSRRSPDAPEVEGVNLNVLLEMGIALGSTHPRLEVLCDYKGKGAIRSKVSNLAGRSPTFLYYDGLVDFESKLRSSVERRVRQLEKSTLFAELTKLPQTLYKHPAGFSVEYPYQWKFIEDANDSFRLIPGVSGIVIHGQVFRSPLVREVVDNQMVNEKWGKLQTLRNVRNLSQTSHFPGKALISYRKAKIRPSPKAVSDYSKLISTWRTKRHQSAGLLLTHYAENLLNCATLSLSTYADRETVKRTEALLGVVSSRVSGFYPGETRTEELIRAKDFRVALRYLLLEPHSDPGEYFGAEILVNESAALSLHGIVGVKIPEKISAQNDIQSEYIFTKYCGDKCWLVFLFGFQFASSPGEVAVIFVSPKETKVCMRRPLEVTSLDAGSTPAEFRMTGCHTYSEFIGDGIRTYDPPSIYGLQRENLVLLESETRKLIKATPSLPTCIRHSDLVKLLRV